MSGVEAVKRNLAGTQDAHIAQNNIGELRKLITSRPGIGVIGIHQNRVLSVANAHVLINNVVNQAAAAGIGLNADTVVGPVDGKVGYSDGARAAIGLAADRHAVAGIEMVV